MVEIPKIKKKIRSFLTKEDGKISKKTLVSAGIVIASFAVAKSVVGQHSSYYNPDCDDIVAPANKQMHDNSLSLGYSESLKEATGRHDHCIEQHSSHGSHGSHTSHGQCSHCSGW